MENTILYIVIALMIIGIIFWSNKFAKRIDIKPKVKPKTILPKIEPTKEQISKSKLMLHQSDEEFKKKLNEVKELYPFDYWYETLYKENEMEQYTLANCKAAQNIMDNLIDELLELGLEVDAEKKMEKFKKAVISFNQLDEAAEGLIETDERETLCEIIDRVGVACGLIPELYGGGDGIASEWREW